nr:acetylxylan esterase [Devosia aurantiaca]
MAMMDDVCPPSTVYAAFKAFAGTEKPWWNTSSTIMKEVGHSRIGNRWNGLASASFKRLILFTARAEPRLVRAVACQRQQIFRSKDNG